MDKVTIRGRSLIFDNQELKLKGMGVGSWLNLEHFMMGMPGVDRMIRQAMDRRCPGLMEAVEDSFFTDEDAAYLTGLGINFIRVPFRSGLLVDEVTGRLRPAGRDRLARLGEICDRNRLFFMPDLHAVPGGQNPDWHSGSETGSAEFWRYRALRDQAVTVWREAAHALAGCRYLMGYDLLNEPVLPDGDKALLNDFHLRAAEAILQEDSEHLLLVEGGRFAMDFEGVCLPDRGKSAYTYHFYPAVWDDSLNDPQMPAAARSARIASAHERVMDTMGDYGGPLLCGETGYELFEDEARGLQMLDETVEVLERRGASWCLWAYKDTGVMGLLSPAEDSAWMRCVNRIAESWSHHGDMRYGDTLARRIAKEHFGSLTEDEIYQLQFRLRAALFQPEADEWIAPALQALTEQEAVSMGDDFSFSRCVVRRAYEAFLRKHAAG